MVSNNVGQRALFVTFQERDNDEEKTLRSYVLIPSTTNGVKKISKEENEILYPKN